MKHIRPKDKIVDLMKCPVLKKRVGIVHLRMIKENHSLYGMQSFKQPGEAVSMVKPLFAMADREMILVMSLNTKLEPLAVEVAAVGGINMCNVDVRNIFKHVLLNNGSYVICFHNHLSNDPEPSYADRMVTRRIQESGRLLGIPLIDHIIVAEKSFYSFMEQGFIENNNSGEVA